VECEYGVTCEGGRGKTAVIEMAKASGIAMVPVERLNPLLTTSYGTGEAIMDAVTTHRCTRVLLGVGGSATSDGM
jgi:glycerate kinase